MLLRDGLSEPEFYGDLVYKFKKLIRRNDFSFQFRNIIARFRRMLSVLPNHWSGVRLYDGRDLKLFILVGWSRSFLSVAWPIGVQLVFLVCSGLSVSYFARDLHRRACY